MNGCYTMGTKGIMEEYKKSRRFSKSLEDNADGAEGNFGPGILFLLFLPIPMYRQKMIKT